MAAANPTTAELKAAYLNRTTVAYRGHSWVVEKIVTGEYELSRSVPVRNHVRRQRHRTVCVRFAGN